MGDHIDGDARVAPLAVVAAVVSILVLSACGTRLPQAQIDAAAAPSVIAGNVPVGGGGTETVGGGNPAGQGGSPIAGQSSSAGVPVLSGGTLPSGQSLSAEQVPPQASRWRWWWRGPRRIRTRSGRVDRPPVRPSCIWQHRHVQWVRGPVGNRLPTDARRLAEVGKRARWLERPPSQRDLGERQRRSEHGPDDREADGRAGPHHRVLRSVPALRLRSDHRLCRLGAHPDRRRGRPQSGVEGSTAIAFPCDGVARRLITNAGDEYAAKRWRDEDRRPLLRGDPGHLRQVQRLDQVAAEPWVAEPRLRRQHVADLGQLHRAVHQRAVGRSSDAVGGRGRPDGHARRGELQRTRASTRATRW